MSDGAAIKPRYKSLLHEHAITFEEQQHSIDKILSADAVIKSPGIPPKVPIVQQIIQANIPILSEIEFASWHTNATIVAITGSAGKTTTTSMIFKILHDAGLNVQVCGNIGNSFALTLANHDSDIFVVEVSSFQLENIYHFKPHIAVITNITENHLDRYEYQMEKYIQAKLNMLKNMTAEDYLVYNVESPHLVNALKEHPFPGQRFGFSLTQREDSVAYIIQENQPKIYINMSKNRKKNQKLEFDLPIEELKVKGKHNEYNSLASAIVGNLFEIRNETLRESLKSFDNLEHRLEQVATINGITYVNDSKATSINSAWFALESMSTPVIWIAGGIDKGNDWGTLKELVSHKVHGIVILGKNTEKIMQAFSEVVPVIKIAASMAEAVKYATQMAQPNYTVLLSPACASFDMFENYEARGNAFKEAVFTLDKA